MLKCNTHTEITNLIRVGRYYSKLVVVFLIRFRFFVSGIEEVKLEPGQHGFISHAEIWAQGSKKFAKKRSSRFLQRSFPERGITSMDNKK